MSDSDRLSSIPSSDFYGDPERLLSTEMLHCERLVQTSAKYDWTIKPHRHENLLQLFYITRGGGKASLDGSDIDLRGGDILLVPPGCIHTFIWQPNSNGFVLFVAQVLLGAIKKSLNSQLNWCRGAASYIAVREEAESIEFLLNSLHRELNGALPNRELMSNHLTINLFLLLDRRVRQTLPNHRKTSRSQARVEQFESLIERNFTEQHQVSWYADGLAIDPAYLNSICQRFRGKSALELVHNRLIREAKRRLIYTPKKVSEIAGELGFVDPAYFNRFFKRTAGSPPMYYRKRAAGDQPS